MPKSFMRCAIIWFFDLVLAPRLLAAMISPFPGTTGFLVVPYVFRFIMAMFLSVMYEFYFLWVMHAGRAGGYVFFDTLD